MTIDEREVLNAKIGKILQHALVYVRAWNSDPVELEVDHRAEMTDLADILHNLPLYIVGLDEGAVDSKDSLRKTLLHHVQKYYPDIKPEDHYYIQLLDMDAESFWNVYRDYNWPALNDLQTANS